MTAVAEQVAQTRTPLPKRRPLRWLLVVGVAAGVIAVGWWILTNGPGVWLHGAPVQAGSVGGSPDCSDGVRSEEVDDTFDGGGTILYSKDGALCTMVMSIANASAVPVTLLSVEKTSPDFVTPLRLVGASRYPTPMSADQDCYGCVEKHVGFTPVTIAPHDEWEIALKGVMSDCDPPKAQGGSLLRGTSTVDLTVRAGGLTRVVAFELRDPWAVRSGGCHGRD